MPVKGLQLGTDGIGPSAAPDQYGEGADIGYIPPGGMKEPGAGTTTGVPTLPSG